MKGLFDFGWAVVYIRGRNGFQEEVLRKLRDRYLSGNSKTDNLMRIWVPGVEKLRSLKLDVGSKVILKYRLHFFTSLNRHWETPNKPSTAFSTFKNGMINQMTVWQRNKLLEQPEI